MRIPLFKCVGHFRYFGRDVISADSPEKMERIEGNRPLRVGKIRRNPARIALAKFFPTSSRVPTSFNGFQRVAVLPIGWVRKAAFHDSRTRTFWIFFPILNPDGAASPFQMRVTHTHTHIWTHL